MADELKVTQADIRVAADFYDAMGWRDVASALRGGFTPDAHDPGPFEALQALARYRIATETQSQATIDELVGALRGMLRIVLPIDMGLAQAECVDEPVADDKVVLSFMGSGASDRVTAGEYRAAVSDARTILSRHKGEGE